VYFSNPTQPSTPADVARREYERSLDVLNDLIDSRAADDEIQHQENLSATLLEFLEATSESTPPTGVTLRVEVPAEGVPTRVVDWSGHISWDVTDPAEDEA